MKANEQKFKVEIWSDVTCVHCYIAKRNFENALLQTEFRSDVEIIWRSFELVPGLKVKPRQSMFEFLAEYNKATVEQVKQICMQITNNAKQVGLEYNLDIAIPANSFRAHMLSHMAKKFDLQNEVKEALLKAHFTDGKNIDDVEVLIHLAAELGIDKIASKEAMEGEQYASQVKQDIIEAQQRGIKGVPYYLFDSAHSLYGSQDSDRYKEMLERSYAIWKGRKVDSVAENGNGSYCEIGKEC